MSEREEDGDGVGKEESGGAGWGDEGQGEDENWADDVERVKVSQADHQTVESVNFLGPPAGAEHDYEEQVAEYSQDGHPEQHHSLYVELKEVGKGLVLSLTVRHLLQERGRHRVG